MLKFLIPFLTVWMLGSQASAENCILKNRIWDFKVKDHSTVILRESRKRAWVVKTFVCPDLPWADGLRFDTRPHGSSWVCRGDKLVPVDAFGRPISPFSCTIKTIEKVK